MPYHGSHAPHAQSGSLDSFPPELLDAFYTGLYVSPRGQATTENACFGDATSSLSCHTLPIESEVDRPCENNLSTCGLSSEDVLFGEILLNIFENQLTLSELAKAMCVSQQWHAIGKEAQGRVFSRCWGLAAVVGKPKHPAAYQRAQLSHFVVRQPLEPQDSITRLAVMHGLDPASLKRANNIISDHSIMSRSFIYVPVTQRELLCAKVASFAYCPLLCRDLIVVADSAQQLEGYAQAHGGGNRSDEERARKLSMMLGRGLKIDESTVRYYLKEAQGDVKLALRLFREDRAWEEANACQPRHRARLGRSRSAVPAA